MKHVWEVNRLQMLPPLAALAVLDGDEPLAELCWSLVESWIDANPPFRGVAWASGIELALRSVSILLVVGLLGADCVPDRLACKLGSCLSAHAFWLARFPSRHSSANNHLIAEAAGLFLLGTLWPAHPSAARHAAYGRGVLVAEAPRQIHADGIGAEQSPSYTALTLEWYLLCTAVADRAGVPLPGAATGRVALAAEALRWFIDGSGNPPRIGDDDDSHVVPSEAGHEALYVASVAGIAAARAGRSDLVPPGPRRGLRGAVVGQVSGPGGLLTGTRTFPDGGYTVHRGLTRGREVLLAFDHGPLGHLSIAAHGHADALALWLHVDGEPVLADAGTYLYFGSEGWRDRFRGTAAHSTLTLGGEDQSLTAGPFNWRRVARTTLIAAAGTGLDVEAEHDGYAGRFGYLCRRRVTGIGEDFAVADRLVPVRRAAGARPSVEIGFLLSPGLVAARDGRDVTVSSAGRAILRLSPTTALTPRLTEVQCSRRFGHREPATRIAFVPEDPGALAFGLRIAVASGTPARASSNRTEALLAEMTP